MKKVNQFVREFSINFWVAFNKSLRSRLLLQYRYLICLQIVRTPQISGNSHSMLLSFSSVHSQVSPKSKLRGMFALRTFYLGLGFQKCLPGGSSGDNFAYFLLHTCDVFVLVAIRDFLAPSSIWLN